MQGLNNACTRYAFSGKYAPDYNLEQKIKRRKISGKSGNPEKKEKKKKKRDSAMQLMCPCAFLSLTQHQISSQTLCTM
jgi:hypothetical protein